MHGHAISIWFFVGLSLLGNGALILGNGLWELGHPPAHPVVLYNLHASVWWGAALLLLGLFYILRHRPGKA